MPTLGAAAGPAAATPARGIPATLALHVAPGILVWLVYWSAAPLLGQLAAPPRAALLLGFLVGGLPFQILVLTRAARARGTTVRSLLARRRAPAWHFLVFVPALLGWAVLVGELDPARWLGGALATTARLLTPPAAPVPALHGLVVATLGLKLVVDGILNPVVEEAYYRGYLLPRLAPLGAAAPLVNAALFAAAHLWQLQNLPAIALHGLGLAVVARWRGTFTFGAAAHALVNLLGTAVALHAALAPPP